MFKSASGSAPSPSCKRLCPRVPTPRVLARGRWEKTLQGMAGVQSWKFERSNFDPPVERPAVRSYAGHVPPMDVTTVWDSLESANTLFGNKDLLIWLWGTVAGAPAVHVAGDGPQQNAGAA